MAERRAAETIAAEPNFLQFNDLACEAVGGKVIFATDEWFAPAANLLKREPPQFIPSAFTEFGKWMDGWETRRKRTTGHDWCIIQLGVPGQIYGFDVDTSFFTGNHSPHISIQAGCLDKPPTFSLDGDRTGMAASDIQLAAVAKLSSEAWPELVCVSELKPGYSDCCHNHFKVNFNHRVTHLRLNIHPGICCPGHYLHQFEPPHTSAGRGRGRGARGVGAGRGRGRGRGRSRTPEDLNPETQTDPDKLLFLHPLSQLSKFKYFVTFNTFKLLFCHLSLHSKGSNK